MIKILNIEKKNIRKTKNYNFIAKKKFNKIYNYAISSW
jgi:hypothetical protein